MEERKKGGEDLALEAIYLEEHRLQDVELGKWGLGYDGTAWDHGKREKVTDEEVIGLSGMISSYSQESSRPG